MPESDKINIRGNKLTEPDERITSGANLSYWLATTEPITYTPLDKDITVDTVIVGGGIAGITTAYLLCTNGVKVAVVDDGNIGSGETGRTTAHLVNALDDRFYELEEYFGEEGSGKAAQSHTAAINLIESIIKTENIECDFMRIPGYLFRHPTDGDDSIKKEYEATRRAGLNTQIIDNVPGIPSAPGPCLVFADQATYHPLKYLKGLCDAITRLGGRIYTMTHADDISGNGIKTAQGNSIRATSIVVATNTPINDRVAIHTKQAPYRTYVIAGLVPKGSIEPALWWDTGDQKSQWPNYPYHYVRLQYFDDDNYLLISGGEDHKSAQALKEDIPETQRYVELEKWTRQHFPMFGEILYKWSGHIMEPVDSLAFIGKNPSDDNIYIATGDSGNGMTHGTIAGMIISDLITGKENDWVELYEPSRKTVQALDTYLVEQANVVEQYTDYLSSGDVDTINDINPNSGAIVRSGLSKVAVYRDPAGSFHAYTAVCPHMKCVVRWNDEEKTFDCPCHGSRFTCYGKVINGPALGDLEQADVPNES